MLFFGPLCSRKTVSLNFPLLQKRLLFFNKSCIHANTTAELLPTVSMLCLAWGWGLRGVRRCCSESLKSSFWLRPSPLPLLGLCCSGGVRGSRSLELAESFVICGSAWERLHSRSLWTDTRRERSVPALAPDSCSGTERRIVSHY